VKLASAVWFVLLLAARMSAAALDEPAHELARRLASLRPATVAVRNLAGLPASEISALRRILRAELGGAPSPGQSPWDLRVTVSANLTETLLVAEALRGTERRVEIVSRPRGEASTALPDFPVTVVRHFLYAQAEPLLDLLELDPARRLALEPGRLVLVEAGRRQTAEIPLAFTPRRDLAGRLAREGATVKLTLPGVACAADAATPLSLQCASAETAPPPETLPLDAVPGCAGYALAAHAAGEQIRAQTNTGRAPQPASAPFDLAGTLTALWPAPGGALAIIYEEKNERYAAYSLAITCGR
jgi:hypothetical protein